MHRLITTISIVMSFTAESWCQQNDFTNRLLSTEKLIFETQDDTLKNLLILKKIQIYTESDSLGKNTLQEILRINPEFLPDSSLASFYWNASVISYLNKEIYKPINYIAAYESIVSDSNLNFKVLKFLIYMPLDTVIANQIYIDLVESDSSLACLSCINETQDFQLKHKKFILNSSLIIPGSGMIMSGSYGKGAISLILNTATVFAVVYLIKYKLFINAIGWGTNLVGKFYGGNIRLTEKSILNKEKEKKNKLAQTCELKLAEVFSKYPLYFK